MSQVNSNPYYSVGNEIYLRYAWGLAIIAFAFPIIGYLLPNSLQAVSIVSMVYFSIVLGYNQAVFKYKQYMDKNYQHPISNTLIDLIRFFNPMSYIGEMTQLTLIPILLMMLLSKVDFTLVAYVFLCIFMSCLVYGIYRRKFNNELEAPYYAKCAQKSFLETYKKYTRGFCNVTDMLNPSEKNELAQIYNAVLKSNDSVFIYNQLDEIKSLFKKYFNLQERLDKNNAEMMVQLTEKIQDLENKPDQ